MSAALLIVGQLTSVAGWFSSAYYDDVSLDIQCFGVAMIVAGGILAFGFGL